MLNDMERTDGIDAVIDEIKERQSVTERIRKTAQRVETAESTTIRGSIYNRLAKTSITLKLN